MVVLMDIVNSFRECCACGKPRVTTPGSVVWKRPLPILWPRLGITLSICFYVCIRAADDTEESLRIRGGLVPVSLRGPSGPCILFIGAKCCAPCSQVSDLPQPVGYDDAGQDTRTDEDPGRVFIHGLSPLRPPRLARPWRGGHPPDRRTLASMPTRSARAGFPPPGR